MENGIEMLACLRMNDRHSNSVEGAFYKAQPEWRIEEKCGGRRWSTVTTN